jgi:hypothetical protein
MTLALRRCVEKVTAVVESLGPQIKIVKPMSSYTDRILELSYQPSPPSFTIRTIISSIASSESFDVSIHRPPSLEERTRSMQAREQSALLYRLTLAVVIGIPTFAISIVCMSLVKGSNSTRAFLMEPMWTGNTSRNQWALFFLATPVQFYSANLFHLRSIKEIRALWRRGSSTPIYKRFIRFGSMNLLVSCCPSSKTNSINLVMGNFRFLPVSRWHTFRPLSSWDWRQRSRRHHLVRVTIPRILIL